MASNDARWVAARSGKGSSRGENQAGKQSSPPPSSPKRRALGEVANREASRVSDWPLSGEEEGGSAVGPNALKWASRHRRSCSIVQLPGTVVIREDEAAQEQQTRWNVWLERGDEVAGDNAEAQAAQTDIEAPLVTQETEAAPVIQEGEVALPAQESLPVQAALSCSSGGPGEDDQEDDQAVTHAESSEREQPIQRGFFRHSSLPAGVNERPFRTPQQSLSDVGYHTPQRNAQNISANRARQPSLRGPVYMRPAAHAKIPSADLGSLNLHEYFSPLSAGLGGSENRASPAKRVEPSVRLPSRRGHPIAAAAVHQAVASCMSPIDEAADSSDRIRAEGHGSEHQRIGTAQAVTPPLPSHPKSSETNESRHLTPANIRSWRESRPSADLDPAAATGAWVELATTNLPRDSVIVPSSERPARTASRPPMPPAAAVRMAHHRPQPSRSYTPLSDSLASWAGALAPPSRIQSAAADESAVVVVASEPTIADESAGPRTPPKRRLTIEIPGDTPPPSQQAGKRPPAPEVAERKATAKPRGTLSSLFSVMSGCQAPVGAVSSPSAASESRQDIGADAAVQITLPGHSPAKPDKELPSATIAEEAGIGNSAQQRKDEDRREHPRGKDQEGVPEQKPENESPLPSLPLIQTTQTEAAVRATSPAAGPLPPPAPPPLPPLRNLPQKKAAMEGAGKCAPPPPPPLPPGSLNKHRRIAPSTGKAQPASKVPAGLGLLSAGDIAAGKGRLRQTAPQSKPQAVASQSAQNASGGGIAISASDLAAASSKLKKVDKSKDAKAKRIQKASSGSLVGSAFQSILRRAQDIRASFYPESTVGSESVCSDWDD